MKDLLFTTDLLTIFQHDKHYGVLTNMAAALNKFGYSSAAKSSDTAQMFRTFVMHIMDQRGESEAFLDETFIYAEAVTGYLKENRLPVPVALLPGGTEEKEAKGELDQAKFEQIFDTVCRNCGTVTDPLANSYRTPIGRLIFKTFLETRRTLGINATGRYVLEHLETFDTDKVVSSISEDGVIWRVDAENEKITSVQTIGKYILNFNREVEALNL